MPVALRVQHRAVVPVLLAVVLTLQVSAVGSAEATVPRSERAASALSIALQQEGDPYRYGAEGPGAFDCSGLVYYSYRMAGFAGVPRTAAQQAVAARRIPRSALQPGDLVLFYGSSGSVHHVALFVGWQNGGPYVVQASHPGTVVKREPIRTNAWFAGTFR